MTTKNRTKKMADLIGAPEYSRRRWQVFIIVLIVTLTVDLVVVKDHAVPLNGWFWEQWPGWNALFGFVSCLLIIFVSKFLGHYCGLMRSEDYYEDDE